MFKDYEQLICIQSSLIYDLSVNTAWVDFTSTNCIITSLIILYTGIFILILSSRVSYFCHYEFLFTEYLTTASNNTSKCFCLLFLTGVSLYSAAIDSHASVWLRNFIFNIYVAIVPRSFWSYCRAG